MMFQKEVWATGGHLMLLTKMMARGKMEHAWLQDGHGMAFFGTGQIPCIET